MFKVFGPLVSALLLGVFAASPSSTNYTLKAYDFGNGSASSSSTNYKLDSSVGPQSGQTLTSTNYKNQSGELPTQNANVPPAPTFTNPSTNYNKLKLVINQGGNPTDVKYAIAISSDGFTTTNYVKSDNSVGTTLLLTDYQIYTAWGGASGFFITGLTPGTTYQVKVKAFQGNFSETAYGPTASATTSQPTISFSVATSLNPTPPFSIGFNGLISNTVFSADADAALTISSNAESGGYIYIKDLNAGLTSSLASFTLASATADLSVAASGYGGQVTATSQSSGGPISSVSPFNGTVNNVGALTTALQPLASTAAPITTGSVTVRFKAKTTSIVPAATDYSDRLTFIAAMTF